MRFNILKTNIHVLALLLLLFSFPYFPFRFTSFNLGITHFAIALCIALGVSLQFRNKTYRLNLFDKALMVFLLIEGIYCVVLPQERAVLVFTKSVVYALGYFSIKNICIHLGSSVVQKTLVRGSILSVVCFSILVVFCMFIFPSNHHRLDFNFSGITLTAYQSLSNLFGYEHKMATVELQRTVVVNGFVFYFIVLLQWKPKFFFPKTICQIFTLSIALCLFSRRAILLLVISFAVYARELAKTKPIAATVQFLGLLLCIYIFVFYISGNDHVRDISVDARVSQLSYVSENSNWFYSFGQGLGAQVSSTQGGEELKYIHNFLISSYYMMGILGFLAALSLFVLIGVHYVGGLLNKSGLLYSQLLLIPLMGLLVGSSIEGIMSPVSWTAIAVYFSLASLSLTESNINVT